jgi:hypothetical protein
MSSKIGMKSSEYPGPVDSDGATLDGDGDDERPINTGANL